MILESDAVNNIKYISRARANTNGCTTTAGCNIGTEQCVVGLGCCPTGTATLQCPVVNGVAQM